MYAAQDFPALQRHVWGVDPDADCGQALLKANGHIVSIIVQDTGY
jgi:hypothetical protein